MDSKTVQVTIRCVNQMMSGVKQAIKEMKSVESAGKKLKNMSVSVKATGTIGAVKRQLQDLVRTVKQKIPVNIQTGTAQKVAGELKNVSSNALGAVKGIKSLAASFIALAAAGSVLRGLGTMLSLGSDLEQQQISMKHFIGVSNSNMSEAEVDKTSQQYLKDLRKNAEDTPFSSTEVVSAGTRAIQLADGDKNKAMDMVKLAEDMAALNPGKTISDAMEALADANVGEMERLKEFGFKISADDFKAAGGDMMAMKDAKGRTLKGVYAGGAAKLAGSGKGLMSTITGSLESGVQDAGLAILQALVPTLQALVPIAKSIGPVFASWGTSIAGVVNSLTSGFTQAGGPIDFLKNAAAQLQPIFDRISLWAIINLPIIGQGFMELVAGLEPLIATGITIIGIFWQIFEAAWPTITQIAGVIKDLLVVAIKLVCAGVTMMWRNFQTASGIIIPILESIWSAIQPVVNALKWIMEKGAGALGKVAGANFSILPGGNGGGNNSTVNQTNNVTVSSASAASEYVGGALPAKYAISRG